MKLRLLVLFCTVILGTACTAPANNTGAASDAVAATGNEVASATNGTQTAEEDQLVCENITRIGTRVSKRVCRRQSQIDATARGSQEALGDIQRRGTQVGNPMGN